MQGNSTNCLLFVSQYNCLLFVSQYNCLLFVSQYNGLFNIALSLLQTTFKNKTCKHYKQVL